MITLITGTPGAGKTLYAVTNMLKEIAKNPERPVFSDIIGLKIEGIETAPDDWRDAPKGSLIIYDECQFKEAYQRARGKTRYDYILQLTTHRHDGYDIWLITQSAKFIHLDVLEVVGRHLHLDRPYGAALANVYEWESSQTNPKSRTAKDSVRSKTLFKYNKNIFEYYSSVDVDDKTANHKKFKIPFSQYKWILIGLCAIAWAVYSFTGVSPKEKPQAKVGSSDVSQLASSEQKSTPIAPITPPPSNTAPPLATSAPKTAAPNSGIFNPLTGDYIADINKAPANVVRFRDRCQIYNHNSQPLINISNELCLMYADNPHLLVRIKQSVSS